MMQPSSAASRGAIVGLSWLCANALWMAVLPSASGRMIGAAGAAISAALLLAVANSATLRERFLAAPPVLLERRTTMALAIVPFVLPALVFQSAPLLGFWRFDGRAALLTAWLATLSLAILLERRRAGVANRPLLVGLLSLFVVFTSILWLSVMLDSGVASFMVSVDRRGPRPCQSDPFTTTINVWESNPAADHLFLGWRSQESFDKRIVYANHVHPYLLLMYGWIGAVRSAAGVPLWVGSNTSLLLPVFALIAAFATLLVRSGLLRERTDLRGLLMLFLALGILLTTWRLWVDLVRFNSDNPYPLLAALLVLIYALLLPPLRTWPAAAAAAVFTALSPTYTPLLLVPVICLFGRSGRDWRELLQKNRDVAIVCAVALAAGIVAYVEPRLLIRWKGYHPQESSFVFRSGLDGETLYFTSLWQAAIRPCPVNCCYGRTLSELLFPAILPLAAFGLPAWRHAASSAAPVGRTLLFLTTPYLLSVILFPQSVSVHPYLYDHLLVIPLVVTGVMAMLSAPVQARMTGAGLLLTLLLAGATLMSNLIANAQGLAKAISYFTH